MKVPVWAVALTLIIISGVGGYLAGSQLPGKTVTLITTSMSPITIIYTKTVTETTPTPPKETFELISWNTTVFHGAPCLYITFRTKATTMLKLIGPDGSEKDSEIVSLDETGAYLHMADYGETPSAGTYKLTASTYFAKVFEAKITLKGYSVKGKSFSVEKSWSDILKGRIEKIVLEVSNTGDMPTFLEEIKIFITGKETSIHLSKPLPVGEVVLEEPTYITGIPPGEHEIKIVLVNDKGEVLDTATAEVTFP